MTGNYLRLADRIHRELDNIETALERAYRGWNDFQNTGYDLVVDSISLNLQAAYNGLEVVFEMIAEEVDRRRPSGDKWHQQLLVQMTSQIDGVRPAVISSDSCQNLNRYRSFRHVVRHIYPFDLEASPIEELIELANPTFTQVRQELIAFAAFLRLAASNL